jgi:SNF2 family DNA or RNA helicase
MGGNKVAQSYKWRTTPYKHQVKAIKKALRLGNHIALLMEPRTGKTKTTIDWASILAQTGKIDRAVVVCPAKVMDVWAKEFHTHSPLNVHVTIWDAQERQRGLSPVSPAYDLSVVVVNYEAFATPGRKTPSGRRSRASGRFKTRTQLQRWLDGKPALGVLDESHKIKNPSGKAATMIVSMRQDFDYRAILTGTVVTKATRVHDVYMQWKFLNPERFKDFQTAEDFKNNYGRWINQNGYPQWVGARNLDEFKARIHADSFAVRRDECFDLPPRDIQVIPIELKPRTAKAYQEMAEDMITTWEAEDAIRAKALRNRQKILDAMWEYKPHEAKYQLLHRKADEYATEAKEHTIEASIKLVQSLRLAQITSGFATTDEGEIVRIGTEKLEVLKELIEDASEADEKVVIAARFKADLDAIALSARSLQLPVFELRGGINRSQATENIRDFKNLSGSGIFIMQPQAGSLGIDLSTASRMVWYSLTTSYVDFTQSCDRIALSRNSTTFTFLLAKGTYDEILYEGLQSDKEVADYVTKRPDRLLLRK